MFDCGVGSAWLGQSQLYKWAGVVAFEKGVQKSRLASISQRSLHNAPIFRLLLKVAVNGTHQCDFPNFCGQQCPTLAQRQHVNDSTPSCPLMDTDDFAGFALA